MFIVFGVMRNIYIIDNEALRRILVGSRAERHLKHHMVMLEKVDSESLAGFCVELVVVDIPQEGCEDYLYRPLVQTDEVLEHVSDGLHNLGGLFAMYGTRDLEELRILRLVMDLEYFA